MNSDIAVLVDAEGVEPPVVFDPAAHHVLLIDGDADTRDIRHQAVADVRWNLHKVGCYVVSIGPDTDPLRVQCVLDRACAISRHPAGNDYRTVIIFDDPSWITGPPARAVCQRMASLLRRGPCSRVAMVVNVTGTRNLVWAPAVAWSGLRIQFRAGATARVMHDPSTAGLQPV